MSVHADLQVKAEADWLRVDASIRDKCVWYLREVISPEDQALIRDAFAADEFPLGFHMFGGTAIRNALREVASDEQLPPVEYGDKEHRNWDDFYMAALRQAVAPKEGEV